MTTPPDTPPGVPFLPQTPRGPASPEAIATALDEPQVVAGGEMPYLPPAPPPKPAISTPQVFDAKTLVDATKRKVENPAYGQLPTGTPEGRAAADAARARMRQKRRRNKMLGWVMAVTLIVVVGGVGYALYTMFQDDQVKEQAAIAADEAAKQANGGVGAATPLGEQAAAAEGLGTLNEGAVASGREATQAIDQAKQAANAANGQSASTTAATAATSIPLADVLPPKIAAVATQLQALDGLTRYMIVVDDAIRADPLGAPGWVKKLQALPQADDASPGLSLVPAVGPGEIAIGLETDGDQVTRLVVLGADPDIKVDI